MRDSRFALIGLLASLLVLSACSTDGAFLEEQEYEAIKAEIANAEELVDALGPPSVTIPRSDGNIVWVYEGVYTQADVTRYIPYVDLVAGTNSKTCTRISVVVNKDDGSLSDWEYLSEKDRDHWSNTNNSCTPRRIPGAE
ncbi:MAG: hypothetical protein QNI99_00875 [Woeseiaceae bacterium]|nr:hypothetical protein [Woeseiaceae bacterium]